MLKILSKLCIFFAILLKNNKPPLINYAAPEIVLKEVSAELIAALKSDVSPELLGFLMQMLAGQDIFNKRELLLRELSKHIYFQETFDLLNRLNSENFEINWHLANYIVEFRALQVKNCAEFEYPQEFFYRLNTLFYVLQPHIPLFIFKKIELMSYYLSYEKWLSHHKGQEYWCDYALKNMEKLGEIEQMWLNFLAEFPYFIQNTTSYQTHRDVFINYLHTLDHDSYLKKFN